MLFCKLLQFKLFHHQLLVAAIKPAAVIASIPTYLYWSCLFLLMVILSPENWYQFSGRLSWASVLTHSFIYSQTAVANRRESILVSL